MFKAPTHTKDSVSDTKKLYIRPNGLKIINNVE